MPTSERSERRWAVVHRVRAGGRARAIPRVIVAGVPAGVSAARVREALEGAGWGLRCSEAGIPWANHSLVPEGRWPERWDSDGTRPPAELSWGELGEGDDGRRVTLRLSGRTHAALTLAAQRHGTSLAALASRILDDAAATSLDDD